MNKRLILAAAGILAVGAAFSACGDDDDPGDAEGLGDAYQELTAALASTTDISNADGDTKDALKDNCGALDDVVEGDAFSDFCDNLGDAVDDEDQVKFDAAKAQWSSLEAEARAAVGEEIGDVADDGDDADVDDDDDTPDADEGITDNDGEDANGDGENDDDEDDDPLTQ